MCFLFWARVGAVVVGPAVKTRSVESQLASVRLSRSRAKARRVAAIGTAKAAVVRFRDGDHMLNVGLALAGKCLAGVRAVDAAAHAGDDSVFDALGIGVDVAVIGAASVFRLDGDGWLLGANGDGAEGEKDDREDDVKIVRGSWVILLT